MKFNQLDLLRGYAAFAVVLYHFLYHFFNVFSLDGGHVFFALGKFGVALFFILSGFLISTTLTRSRPFNFLLRRAIRLLPTFAACCFITYGVILATGFNYRGVDIFDFLANFLIFPSWFGFTFVDGSYWTLEYEWVFYLICFFSYAFLSYMYHFISIFLLGMCLIRIFYVDLFPDSFVLGGGSLLFLLGVSIAKIYQLKTLKNTYFCLIFVALFLLYITEKYWFVYFSLTFIFVLAVYERLIWLDNFIFRFLAKISYPLYLLHQSIGFTAIIYLNSIGLSYFWSISISILLILILSLIVHHEVELKLTLKLKNMIKL